jgi:hypothetical protein
VRVANRRLLEKRADVDRRDDKVVDICSERNAARGGSGFRLKPDSEVSAAALRCLNFLISGVFGLYGYRRVHTTLELSLLYVIYDPSLFALFSSSSVRQLLKRCRRL